MSEEKKKQIEEFIKKINSIYEEIKAIKNEKCIMDYDTKTKIIQQKETEIALLNMAIDISA